MFQETSPTEKTANDGDPNSAEKMPPVEKPDGKGKAKNRADEIKKLKLWMAWWGLVVLGIGLVTFVMLAGWRARRLARQRSGPSRLGREDWHAKPLTPPLSEDDDSP